MFLVSRKEKENLEQKSLPPPSSNNFSSGDIIQSLSSSLRKSQVALHKNKLAINFKLPFRARHLFPLIMIEAMNLKANLEHQQK